jgi:hypothetical protein
MVGAAHHRGHFPLARPDLASSRKSPSGSGSPCCSPISPKPSPKAAARRRPRRCAARASKPAPTPARNDGQTEDRGRHRSLRKGDVVLVRAGEIIPADGEVIEGAATVDESAITGESAPVIRESGGDRSAVTGGTRVLSTKSKSAFRQSRRRFSGPHDCAGRRREPPENAERNRAHDSARGADGDFSARCVTLKPFGIYSGVNFSVPC